MASCGEGYAAFVRKRPRQGVPSVADHERRAILSHKPLLTKQLH